MTDFTEYDASTHPEVKLEDDYNSIVDHAFKIPAHFLVWLNSDTSKYEARYGVLHDSAGKIYGTANASLKTLMDDLLANALTSGRTWKEKVVLIGDLAVTDPITLKSYVDIELMGRILVDDGISSDVFLNETNPINDVEVHGGFYDMQAGDHGVLGGEYYDDVEIHHIKAQNFAVAVYLKDSSHVKIHHLDLYGADTPTSTDGRYGIWLQNWTNEYYVQIYRNRIRRFYESGIHIDGSVGASTKTYYVDITDNKVFKNYNSTEGTIEADYLSGFIITGNITGLRQVGSGDFKLNNSEYGIVDNNDFLDETIYLSSLTDVKFGKNRGLALEAEGSASFDGDGSTTQFDIDYKPSDFYGIPTVWFVEKACNLTQDIEYTEEVSVGFPPTRYIRVHFESAPPAGSDNVILKWRVKNISYD